MCIVFYLHILYLIYIHVSNTNKSKMHTLKESFKSNYDSRMNIISDFV